MAIKTIKFTGLTSSALQYTAIGGIRFYDANNTVIPSGAIITNSTTSAETDNFLLTATNGYDAVYYYVGSAFNTNAPQTGADTNRCYWLSINDNQTLTCEFKTPISQIGKIEFVPLPEPSYTNRGVDEQFNIELWDEFDTLIITYTITPITTNNTVQTVDIVLTTDAITVSICSVSSSNGLIPAINYDKILAAQKSTSISSALPISININFEAERSTSSSNSPISLISYGQKIKPNVAEEFNETTIKHQVYCEKYKK